MSCGTLYIVSTPIGNLEDITLRAIRILSEVYVVLCEDTRKTGMLLEHLKKEEKDKKDQNITKPRLISFYDEVEEQKVPEVIELLESGKNVALVSDAGTPLISDPGFLLVRECYRRSIRVSPIPGPSSVMAALSVSGLPTERFTYLGYLPKKEGKRTKLLMSLKNLGNSEIVKTIVFFETPHRLPKTLSDMKEVVGDIEIVVARELTKMHEEIWRGTVSDAIKHFKDPKGEFVIMIQSEKEEWQGPLYQQNHHG